MISKIINELFDDIVKKFGSTRNHQSANKINQKLKKYIIDMIVNDLFDRMNSNETLKNSLTKSENHYKTMNPITQQIIEDFHYDKIFYQIKDYVSIVKIFSIALIKNKKLKLEQMRSFGIELQPYKPSGSKVSRERSIIYYQIKHQISLLEEEYGKNKRGKSDHKTAVYKAIKFLEGKKVIKKSKYDPEKVYESWKKRKNKELNFYSNPIE